MALVWVVSPNRLRPRTCGDDAAAEMEAQYRT